ncbi:hypothetical protein [Nocardioides sediminis]|uniref:hypothetical protein n=1 Tax=Nocardioides sediminis TaxID=433648 RepID=UPI00131F47AA|nr:hypothetical protein [Nocardioides sediminis]
MTRILLGLAVLLLLSACTSDAGSGATEGSEPDAETVKAEMDGEAKALLPDLLGQVGGEVNGMLATFSERGGFGIWDYVASGAIVKPSGTMTESLAAVETVLVEHGYTVEADDERKRVTGTKGNVSVTVEASLLTAEKKGSGLNIRIGSSGIQDGDDFAESAPAEDYLTYVR